MPELPEVETIRRDLQKLLKGKTVTRIDVRTPKLVRGKVQTFRRALAGKKIAGFDRRGKLLIVRFVQSPITLLTHLKMTGQLIYERRNVIVPGGHPIPSISQLPSKHTHIIYHFNNGA